MRKRARSGSTCRTTCAIGRSNPSPTRRWRSRARPMWARWMMPPRRPSEVLTASMRGRRVVEHEDLQALRDVRLVEQAVAGDVNAAIRWLREHDPAWRHELGPEGP